MRELTPAIDAALESGVTTLCRCWAIERRDGVVLGFTDHDLPLSFEGIDFAPETGFTRTELERSLGLSVDNMEATGALRSDAITEEDIALGLYDGARVTQWLVDWTAPENRMVAFAGRVGEIRRGAQAFEVEFTGLSDALNRPMGRVYLRSCDAELGDARCGVTLTAAAGSVLAVLDGRRLRVAGFEDAEAHPEGWYALGRLVWRTGANAGRTESVLGFARRSGGVEIELWKAPAAAPSAGDAFDLYPGCDKSAATCRDKFANLTRFRGFPHMPGEDWAAGYPGSEEDHDGGSLFR
ncbi:DUF2163 domain-containing protein [Oceanicella actignis]|uniref:Bacteriophage phiJL001 Gp84 C-terminal domain-containing protein n=1 Tax=Oceanicella actignis TaxID=1189325 RepID=A0A1M7TZU5_9RHOB|nr:DUF2163 domain-containing protein [Oceanicella actignis]SET83665.1 phage conserved hypothetical protein BR0599 [Oceanicella actignis]SHN76249.1 phage conserved hypothetical protein BR0599 [Oceanicella actignis]